MKCNFCGFENDKTEKYCFICGRMLVENVVSPSSPQHFQPDRSERVGLRSFQEGNDFVQAPNVSAALPHSKILPLTGPGDSQMSNGIHSKAFIKRKCKFCGFENDFKDLFCFICGRQLGDILNAKDVMELAESVKIPSRKLAEATLENNNLILKEDSINHQRSDRSFEGALTESTTLKSELDIQEDSPNYRSAGQPSSPILPESITVSTELNNKNEIYHINTQDSASPIETEEISKTTENRNSFWDYDYDALFRHPNRMDFFHETAAGIVEPTREKNNIKSEKPSRPEYRPWNNDTLLSPGENLILSDKIDEHALKMEYLVGNKVGENLMNRRGEVMAEHGEKITLELIEKIENEGQLAELIAGMILPDMEL